MGALTLVDQSAPRAGSRPAKAGGAPLAIGLIAAMLLVKLAVAAVVPLVPDETYYALWSQDLAAGYLDHPPMIAFFVRAGTSLLGENALGVRLVCVLAGLTTSWFIWQAARSLAGAEAGALAATLFNATLFGFFGVMLATPDAPVTLFSAAMLYCATRLVTEPAPVWWLALGLATGLAMESKYSAALLAVALAGWIVAEPSLRRHLTSPWPWCAVLVALAVFLPNLLWNQAHDWQTFAKQGGRVVEPGGFSLDFVPDLLIGQLGLATPLIYLFGLTGLVVAAGVYRSGAARRLIAFGVLVPMAYFCFHALRTKVEANWPGFLYPLFAIAAAVGMLTAARQAGGWLSWFRYATIPFAVILIALIALQGWLTPVTAFGSGDPIIRQTRGWQAFAADVERLARQTGSSVILTDDYQTNAELRWFIKDIPVEQWNERDREGALPPAQSIPPGALYVADNNNATSGPELGTLTPIAHLTRRFGGAELGTLTAFRVSAP